MEEAPQQAAAYPEQQAAIVVSSGTSETADEPGMEVPGRVSLVVPYSPRWTDAAT